MLRHLLAVHLSSGRQWMPHPAHRHHLDTAQNPPLEGFGYLVMIKQQTQIGSTLHQLARHIALGRERLQQLSVARDGGPAVHAEALTSWG